MWTFWDVSLVVPDRLAGSIPGNPIDLAEMVRRQIREALGESKQETREAEFMRRLRFYLEEIGTDTSDIEDAKLERYAQEQAGARLNVFRRTRDGYLWFGSHCVKAALREAASILCVGQKWGPTKKGVTSYLVERIFIDPEVILVERDGEVLRAPDGQDQISGSVSGPGGSRAIISHHEFVEDVTLNFQIRMLARAAQMPLKKAEKKAEEEVAAAEASPAKGRGRRKSKVVEAVPDVSPEELARVQDVDLASDATLADLLPILLQYVEIGGLGSKRRFSGYGRCVVTRFAPVRRQ